MDGGITYGLTNGALVAILVWVGVHIVCMVGIACTRTVGYNPEHDPDNPCSYLPRSRGGDPGHPDDDGWD